MTMAKAKLYSVTLHRDRVGKCAQRITTRVWAADKDDAEAWARTVAAEPDAKWWRYDQTLQWDEHGKRRADEDGVRVVRIETVRDKKGKAITE